MAEGRILKKKPIPYWLKRQITIRDKFTCQCCGKIGEKYFNSAIEYKGFSDFDCTMPKPIRFEIDHIAPEFLGGETTENNLQLLCRECNRKKGVKKWPKAE